MKLKSVKEAFEDGEGSSRFQVQMASLWNRLRLRWEKVVQWLMQLARIAGEEEKVPDDWVKQLTVPLHKKGFVKVCYN